MARSAKYNAQMRTAAKTAVLHSAMTLFAQNGYAHTTTRQIAQEAGVSSGLMYHYFENKEALLQAVFDHSIGKLNDAFTTVYQQSSPDQRLTHLLQTIFDLLAQEPAFWSLFYMLRTQPAIMQLLGDAFRQWTKRLRDLLITELREHGRATPELDAWLLYSLIEGTIQQYLLDPDIYPLEELSAEIIKQFGTPNQTNIGDDDEQLSSRKQHHYRRASGTAL